MDSYCVIGNPVAHSRSPWIHARFAELTNQSLDYGRRLVAGSGPGDFAQAIAQWRAEADAAGERACGCNVTVPFKHEAAALAGRLTPRAALAGAVNVLTFDDNDIDGGGIRGDNSDGVGLVRDLERNAMFQLAGRDVLLLGAGGAAAGVLGPLLECGPRRLVVANRTLEKAVALVQRHAALALSHRTTLEAQALGALTEQVGTAAFDLLINATATSLQGAQVPVAPEVMRPDALAIDLMYGPSAAAFGRWARAHGLRARDGLGMLVEQAAEAFAIWRGVRPPSAQVLEALRADIG